MRAAMIRVVGVLTFLLCSVGEANLWTQKKKDKDDKARSTFDSLLKAEKGVAGGKGAKGQVARPGGLGGVGLGDNSMADMATLLDGLKDMDIKEVMVQFLDEMITQLQQPEFKTLLEDPDTLTEIFAQLPSNMRQGMDISAFTESFKTNPKEYKENMDTMVDTWIDYMTKLKGAMKDPAVMKTMMEELLDDESLAPDAKAQLRKFIDDPDALMNEIMSALETMGGAGGEGGDDALQNMIEQLSKDPELANLFSGDGDELGDVMAELMKDPEFSKLMKESQEL